MDGNLDDTNVAVGGLENSMAINDTMDQSELLVGEPPSKDKALPLRGQSVKEYEETLDRYMKENFNLKLRIFFLEERFNRVTAGGNGENIDDEEECKSKMVLQLENEKLQKDLAMKQDLLRQALKALEIMEAEQQKQETVKQEEMNVYIERINFLESQIDSLQCQLNNHDEKEIEILQHQIDELHTEMEYVQNSMEEERNHAQQLQNSFDMNIQQNSEKYENEIATRDAEIESLRSELNEKVVAISKINERVHEMESHLQSYQCIAVALKEKTHQLETQIGINEELQNNIQRLTSQNETLRMSMASRGQSSTKKETSYDEKNRRLKPSPQRQLSEVILESHIGERDEKIKRLYHELENRDKHIKSMENENVRLLQTVREFVKREQNRVDEPMEKGKLVELIRRRDTQILNLKKENRSLRDALVNINPCDAIAAINSGDNDHVSFETKGRALPALMAPKNFDMQCPKSDSECQENEDSDQRNIAELSNLYSEHTTEMEKQIQTLLKTLSNHEDQLKKYENTLQTKENHIVELESEIEDIRSQLFIAQEQLANVCAEISDEKSDTEKAQSEDIDWPKILESRDKEIERLEVELRKRTINLQELVNKELWDKNREIERLQKRIQTIADQKESEIGSIKNELHNRDSLIQRYEERLNHLGSGDHSQQVELIQQQLSDQKEQNHYLSQKVADLAEKLRNAPERENENRIISTLRNELSEIKGNLIISEKSKQEVLDICSMLTTRLEELALFLNSLLKHKSVLGFLGVEKKNALKNVVEKSLDLSRTLSMSISVTGDQSLLQLTSISEILLNATHPSNISDADFTSTDMEDLSTLLRNFRRDSPEKSVNLVELKPLESVRHPRVSSSPKECDNSKISVRNESKRNSLDAKQKSVNVENSDTDSWSEPDRSVSLARIGIIDETIKSPGVSVLNRSRNSKTVDSTSEEERPSSAKRTPVNSSRKPSEERSMSSAKRNLFGSNECRHNSPTLQEQVIKLQNELKEKEEEIQQTRTEMYELSQALTEDKIRLAQQYDELLKQKAESAIMVSEADEKVRRAERKKSALENEVMKLEVMAQELIKKKSNESIVLENNLRTSEETIEVLLNERDSAKLEASEAQKRADSSFVDTQLYKMRLTSLQESYDKLEFNKSQIENSLRKQLEEMERQLLKKISENEEMAAKIEHVEHNEAKLKALSEKLVDLERTQVEINNLRKALKAAEEKIQLLESNEKQLQKCLLDTDKVYKEKIAGLRKELDAATLLSSQTAVERAKINNEKVHLETLVHNLKMNISELKRKECDLVRRSSEHQRKESELKQLLDQREKEITNKETQLQESLKITREEFAQKIIQIEADKTQLEIRVNELQHLNSDLQSRLFKLQVPAPARLTPEKRQSPTQINSSPSKHGGVTHFPQTAANRPLTSLTSEYSGYASEDIPVSAYEAVQLSPRFERSLRGEINVWSAGSNGNNNGVIDEDRERVTINSSPDLGIESDQGRMSSIEGSGGISPSPRDVARPFLPPLEISESMNNLLATATDNDVAVGNSDIEKLKNENSLLKARLVRTHKALQFTVREMSKSNERKKQVEKAVCTQIHKTSLVLRKARANLDSGSETEIPPSIL